VAVDPFFANSCVLYTEKWEIDRSVKREMPDIEGVNQRIVNGQSNEIFLDSPSLTTVGCSEF
jgi:hypothetical protein